MSAAHNGGPAFPRPAAEYQEDCGDFKRAAYCEPQDGMTLRDYFTAKALSGVHMEYLAAANGRGLILTDYRDMAADAYTLADAMLKARET